MPIWLECANSSEGNNSNNPIVRILLTETETKILYDKQSTVKVFYQQQSTSSGSTEDVEEDIDSVRQEKIEVFMKDVATQTLQSDCFVMVKHKSTNYNG